MAQTSTVDLMGYGTATLYDAARRLNLEIGLQGLSSVAPASRFAAKAFTVRYAPKSETPAEPLNYYDIIHQIPQGHAMVVEVGADRWTLGANVTRFCQLSGLAGIVTDGSVRDIATIRERGFPVFARGASVVGYAGALVLHSFGGTIQCAGVPVATDDWIVADEDGVVCVPAARLDEIIYEADDIMQLDAELAGGIEARRPLDELHKARKQWGVRRTPSRGAV